MPEEQL